MYGDKAARIFIDSLAPDSRVLDVGAGREKDFRKMVESAGHVYVPLDLSSGDNWELYIRPSYMKAFDAVWMSHCLEHMKDTHSALVRIHHVLRGAGVVGITVPPLKSRIVGGHVSLWNAGLLLYRLVLAGFDCRQAAVKTYGYNCSVVVRRKKIDLPELRCDNGDIDAIKAFLPVPVNGDSYDGDIKEVNWWPA